LQFYTELTAISYISTTTPTINIQRSFNVSKPPITRFITNIETLTAKKTSELTTIKNPNHTTIAATDYISKRLEYLTIKSTSTNISIISDPSIPETSRLMKKTKLITELTAISFISTTTPMTMIIII
jgi:hypothetical protein